MLNQITAERILYRRNSSPCEIEQCEIKLPLKPNQVLVKTAAMSLNPLDLKLKSIAYIPGRYHIGADMSGVVEQVGSKAASQFSVGDRVSGIAILNPVGSHTLVDVRFDRVFRSPKSLSDEEAAAFPSVMGTAYGLVNSAPKLAPGSRVAVLGGATSVGSFVLQLLRKQHGVQSIVSVNSEASNKHVLSFGATETVDYKTVDVPKELTKIAQRDGLFDYIFDTAGGDEVLKAHKSILKPASEGGSYFTIAGDASPSINYSSPSSMFGLFKYMPRMVARIAFGKWMNDLDYRFVTMPLSAGWVDQARNAFEYLGVTVPIDSIYPLRDFNKAIEYFQGANAHGKVLISFKKN